MNKEDYISTLPQAEQKALSVCGIYKAQQLSSICVSDLYADMQQAAEFFPDEVKVITKERLIEIYAEAEAAMPVDEPIPAEQPKQLIEVVSGSDFERTLPPLERKHGTRHRSPQNQEHDTIDLTKVKTATKVKANKSGAICNTHPFRTLFSAVVQLWLIAALILFCVIAARLVLGITTDISFTDLMILLLSGVLPYVLYTRKTKCPVCNMGIFTFQNFTRNKYAHHLPVLGYSIATALHILFFFWFRCPACGTSQKLFKRKRR